MIKRRNQFLIVSHIYIPKSPCSNGETAYPVYIDMNHVLAIALCSNGELRAPI